MYPPPGPLGLPQIEIISWELTIKNYPTHEEAPYKGLSRNKEQQTEYDLQGL